MNLQDLLAEIGLHNDRYTKNFCSKSLSKDIVTESFFFESKGLNLKKNGFGKNCRLHFFPEALAKLNSGAAKLILQRMGDKSEVDNINIFIGDFNGKVSVLVGSEGNVFIGSCGQLSLDIRLGHGGLLLVGDTTTVNHARLVAVNSEILLGIDCMLSDEILMQGFDQHGIIDLDTMSIVNADTKNIILDDHVWVGRRATILPGVTINKGSIVGACAVVTASIPAFSISVGVPSKVVKEKASWSRAWKSIDDDSACFISENYF